MLTETDRQVAAITPENPNTFFVSVGVGILGAFRRGSLYLRQHIQSHCDR